MHCPYCDARQKVRVKICHECGEAFAIEDFIELAQLKFLAQKTEAWDVPESLRAPYLERLEVMRTRFQQLKPEAAAAPASEVPAASPAASAEAVVPAARPAKPKDSVPFDQWLLSERNIKIALYSGGLLLVLAGLIFVGVNWTRIPGPGKFAITLMLTGLMYLGGYLLFQRPAYQLGGVALLGVASGFLTLNFAVLQIYVLGPSGLRNDVMWLIASPICLLLYILTAYWTRSDLFIYISVAALGSTATAAVFVFSSPPQLAEQTVNAFRNPFTGSLTVTNVPVQVYLIVYSLLMLFLLFLVRLSTASSWEQFARVPLTVTTQGAMALLMLTSFSSAVSDTGWLSISILAIGVGFYALTDFFFRWPFARWVAAPLFAATLVLSLLRLNITDTAAGVTLMLTALALLGLGYWLERREQLRAGAWPLYATAYAVAALVTAMASQDPEDLILILIGDVILLAVSAAIQRVYAWVYGAVWLFMLPVYLLITLFVSTYHLQGLLLSILGLNYLAAGYALGRRQVMQGLPFLSAAAFLSVVIAGLTWGSALTASLVLSAIVVLYILAASWLNRQELLLPALVAVNLAIFHFTQLLFPQTGFLRSLPLAYEGLGLLLVGIGLTLRQSGRGIWAWPLYLVGALDLSGAYAGGLWAGHWYAVGLSVASAILLFVFAWIEQAEFTKRKLPHLTSYLGLGALFIGHFFLIDTLNTRLWNVWPALTAGFCAVFIALSWLLRRGAAHAVYASPLRFAGLALMLVPMAGAVLMFAFSSYVIEAAAVTFGIAGAIFGWDAAMQRQRALAYPAAGSFLAMIWAILIIFEVTEPQAYALPLGLVLLGAGWFARRQGLAPLFRVPTLLGLLVLMGSAFVQSLPRGAFVYALILTVESVAAVAWGIRVRSRGYVRVGGLALIANAIAQLGPGFVELPRWIQLGAIGTILLGSGLGALFKRQDILQARERLTNQWSQWNP